MIIIFLCEGSRTKHPHCSQSDKAGTSLSEMDKAGASLSETDKAGTSLSEKSSLTRSNFAQAEGDVYGCLVNSFQTTW